MGSTTRLVFPAWQRFNSSIGDNDGLANTVVVEGHGGVVEDPVPGDATATAVNATTSTQTKGRKERQKQKQTLFTIGSLATRT